MKYDVDSIKKRKSINNRIKKIIFIFLILVLYNIVIIYMSYIDKFDTPSFYIFKAYTISTDSMYPEIKQGDVIIIKKAKEEELKQGDIITFKEEEKVITHRIVEIKDLAKEKKYITKGDNNNINDEYNLTYDNIEGELLFKIPYLGNILGGLKNGIIIILTILIFLVIYLTKIGMKEKSEIRREKKKIEDQKFIGKE